MIAKATIGKRIALISISVSATLSAAKIVIGLLAHSTSVVADGAESAGDVVASSFVLFGFILAAKPPDEQHPYGFGRYETLTGLIVGLILFLGASVSPTGHFRTLVQSIPRRPCTECGHCWPL